MNSPLEEPTVDERSSVFAESQTNPAETYRPALVKLSKDTRSVLRSLMEGFETRRGLVEWTQELCVRTLGEIDDEWYSKLSHQLRHAETHQERVTLSCLLTPDARQRSDIEHEQALELRRRIAATHILPAHHRAFRNLRKDAGEYVGDARDEEHDPLAQRFLAMRPSLDELDERQADVLERALDGFESREDILDWAGDVELATHGEVDFAHADHLRPLPIIAGRGEARLVID